MRALVVSTLFTIAITATAQNLQKGSYGYLSTINRVWAPQIFWDPSYVWENGEKGGYKKGGHPGIYTATSKHLTSGWGEPVENDYSDPVDIEGVTGPQHGSFMRLTEEEYNRLLEWSKQ